MKPLSPYAEVLETHSGVVLLCGERAYKAKKPIVTDFLDFGTAAARERACRRELELNRRFSPDVYLGLARLSDPEGGPDEPIVVMRRMPDDRRLASMLGQEIVSRDDLRTLATMVARFHATARRGADVDRAGTASALRERWRVLLHSLSAQPAQDLDPGLVARADRLVMGFIDGREPLFTARIEAGRIVDGHGDLLAEDIFLLPDGFRVLDCLDFDDALRYVDGVDDAAFLTMDLEFLGYPTAAGQFLDDYLRAAEDAPPAALRHHYIAYRAMVRAKTDRVRAAQGDPAAPAHARLHLELALRHLESGAVRLALVGGLPGSGKSTVAQRLAACTGAEVVSTDHLRHALRAAGSISGDSGRYGAGAYRRAARRLVYERLLDHARERLEHGVSVILDAAWLDSEHRGRATALAKDTSAELIALRCVCPREMAAARIRDRAPGESEATPEIADALAAAAHPWPEATVLDTSQHLDQTLTEAVRAWETLGG